MVAPFAPTMARHYFRTESDLQECLQRAAARARSERERGFTEELGKRVERWGMQTYITSRAAAWLNRLAKREPPKRAARPRPPRKTH